MECNKEEAIKAMQIAEKKLLASDFMGARKMAQTAHRLYPTLENITQLLTVCDIHCSAQNRIFGSDKDWYKILQIEQSADELTIKKQYRKLALLLHPDKNKFAGAETAFKLVGEANRLFSDQAKRKLYDMKYKVATRNIAPPQPSRDKSNGYTAVKQEGGTANGYSSVPYSQFSGRTSCDTEQAFWTCCPFCNVRYQYLKCYLNRMLRCQNCGRGFISHDLNNQTVPTSSHQSHVSQAKVASETGRSKSTTRSKLGCERKSQDRCAGVDQAPRKGSPSGNDLSAKAGKKHNVQHGNVEVGQGGRVEPRSDAEMTTNGEKSRSDAATSMEQGASKTGNKKRRQKAAGKGCENVQDGGDFLSEKDPVPSRDNHHRRSLRHKKHVSYRKYLSENDDDLGSLAKKSSSSAPSTDWKEKMEDATGNVAESKVDNSSVCPSSISGHTMGNKCEVTAPLSKVLPNRKHKYEELKVMRDGTNTSDRNSKKSKVEGIDADKNNVTEVRVVVCADPEFSNFDKDKVESCFAVNQIWAIYDTTDGMPRFYARIKKVFSPVFKLQITWFEPNPDDKDEIDWCDAELPVACGKYSLGETEETVDLPMFSHLVHSLKRGPRGAYLIYPQKGETWALFKNWDIRWRSELEKHVPFKYEFVEILSDYVEDAGILVAYLDKIKGFTCLFQHPGECGLNSIQIPPSELFRFSHRIPSFRMAGEERKGVPKGSLELDPAALPANINDHNDFNDVKMEIGDVPSGRNKVEADGLENMQAAQMQKKSNPKNEAAILRRSPRKLNMYKNGSQINIDQYMPEDDGIKDASHSGLPTHKESIAINANGETSTPKKYGKKGIERVTVILRRSPRDSRKMHVNV